MENPISITLLNDFIFCPASIYFHMIDAETDKISYQTHYQLNGTAAHEKSDTGKYSSRKDVLQSIFVYCEKYNLIGKIDTFDVATGLLTERKRTITHIYDGYVFQLYAQYFSLMEMGYNVKKIKLYSMTDNKSYYIELPEVNVSMLEKFEKTISEIKEFDIDKFSQSNSEKCEKCIYETLCAYSKKQYDYGT